MNRFFLFAFSSAFVLLSFEVFSQIQVEPPPQEQESDALQGQNLTNIDINSPSNFSKNFDMGLNYTNIDGESYIGLRLQPEFEIGKLGVGMSIPLYYNLDKQRLRTEAYSDWTALLRIFRYVRYGQKRVDDFYIKVGDLTGAYIGYGLLLSNYSNAYSEDKRKIGFEWDFKLSEWFGLEGLYSDVNSQSFTLLTLRPYVLPLNWTGIPIVKTLELGITYTIDKDATTQPNLGEGKTYNRYIGDGVNALGFDAGVTLLSNAFIRMTLAFQHAQLFINSARLKDDLVSGQLKIEGDDCDCSSYKAKYEGSGTSIGLNTNITFLANVFSLGFQIDRLWYTENFLPQFFNASYEINKDTRISSLVASDKKQGIYGNLTAQFFNALLVRGVILLPDAPDETNPAMINLGTSLDKFLGKYNVRLSYYKGNLSSLSEAFDPDQAVLSLRVGYYPYQYLLIGVDYFRTFAKKSDESQGVVYDFVDQVSPFISFQLPL